MYTAINDELDTVWNMYQLALEELIEKHDEESNIPEISTGISVGLISMVGFSPDVFMPILGGYLLDKFPEGLGYQYYFGAIAMICWVGVFMGVYVLRGRKSSEIQRS